MTGIAESRRPTLLIVSPRPPKRDGTGDQARAYQVIEALSATWDIEVVSWLEPVQGVLAALREMPFSAVPKLLVDVLTVPMPVAYSRALAPRDLVRRGDGFDLVLYVTDRAVPRGVHGRFVMDFVDDLGGAALRRAQVSNGLGRPFWRCQALLTRRLDRRLAKQAVLSIAAGQHDAGALGPHVLCIPSMVPPGDGVVGRKSSEGHVVFTGNLFFGPNDEAALWICQTLVPALSRRGVQPACVIIAGRRPSPRLRKEAERSGVRLLPDVDDMQRVLSTATVVIAPMRLGSGIKIKILEAVAMGKPCIVTSEANEGVGLIDGDSVMVRPREADAFADAISDLLGSPALRQRIAEAAIRRLATHSADTVLESWRMHFDALKPVPVQPGD